MLIIALVLSVVGVTIMFGSFVFAAVNMGRSFSTFDNSFDASFQNHIKAIVGLALGGLCAALGGIIAVFSGVSTLFAAA